MGTDEVKKIGNVKKKKKMELEENRNWTNHRNKINRQLNKIHVKEMMKRNWKVQSDTEK